ncbi:hypothetical protein ABIA31_003339 [Catenulispora sp. MAP5-51]|uniref:hypothetical protein n=1 Tax=Catenulispora sp. MAP5-51 TaxID=3156298 RepID=UPI0035145D1D
MGVADKFLGSKRDRFGKEVAAQVRGHASVAHAEYDMDDFVVRVRTSDGRQSVVNLATVFQECEGVPAAERRGRISRLVAIVDTPAVPDTWDQVRPLLRPVLRPASYVSPGEIISRPVLEYLTEFLAIDFPGSRTYVNPESRLPWDIVAEEVGLTPADGCHPARYRVGSWPAPEVLNRMKARAEQSCKRSEAC